MRNHRRPKALHEQVLLFIQPVESQSQLELCMLRTPRGHPCARAPHVQGPDGPVLGTCALPALQDSPPLSTAAAYTAVPHQGSTDLVHGTEGAHGCRVNAALAQYAGCLAPEAPSRQARQAMLW